MDWLLRQEWLEDCSSAARKERDDKLRQAVARQSRNVVYGPEIVVGVEAFGVG